MVRICKTSLDLLQFLNFSIYPMLWQFWKKKNGKNFRG
jgi:hypothetical protein